MLWLKTEVRTSIFQKVYSFEKKSKREGEEGVRERKSERRREAERYRDKKEKQVSLLLVHSPNAATARTRLIGS